MLAVPTMIEGSSVLPGLNVPEQRSVLQYRSESKQQIFYYKMKLELFYFTYVNSSEIQS